MVAVEKPGFIVPPPGIVPERVSTDSETVRVPERRKPLPAFVPTPPGAAPAVPPAADAAPPAPPAAPAPPVPAAPESAAPEPAAPGPVAPESAAPGPEAREEAPETAPTRVTDASESAAPPAEERTEAARPTPVPQWSIALHDGSVVHVTGTLLIGRDPAPAEGWRFAGLMRLNDPERSVSKTHAGLDCSDGRFVITDLDSTNGTAVIAEDGTETVLEPRVAAEVPDGATVEFGRYRVRVHRG